AKLSFERSFRSLRTVASASAGDTASGDGVVTVVTGFESARWVAALAEVIHPSRFERCRTASSLICIWRAVSRTPTATARTRTADQSTLSGFGIMLGNVQRNVYRPGTGTQTDCDDDYREQNEKNRQGKDAFSRSMPSSLPAYLLKPSFERNTITADATPNNLLVEALQRGE